ncbi:hypothetical protein ACGFWF_19310 [Streptomyces sp. NPDC048581]|uniref:hypothetical protein n=1 Tax=Streptomyces sp. NPDC048581 TaxID=3365572 RepID=UPI00371FC69E
MAPGALSAAASDAVGACYLDLWICDRLLRHDGGNRSAAARCLVPVLLLEGVGGIAPVLGARLHRPDVAAVEYRRRRRVLVRAVRERSPQTWERLGQRLARIATGEDRLARPLTPVRGRGLPQPLAELVGLLEAERRELAAVGAESVGGEPPHALLERCALLTAAAACLDGWQEAGPHRHGPERHGTAGPGNGRPGAWPTARQVPLPGSAGGSRSELGSSFGCCGGDCSAGYDRLSGLGGGSRSGSASSFGCCGGDCPAGYDPLSGLAGVLRSASVSSSGICAADCSAGHHPLSGPAGGPRSASGSSFGPCSGSCPVGHHPRARHPGEAHSVPRDPSGRPDPSGHPGPSVHPASLGVSMRRARLCGALYRLAVRLDLRVSDGARTAWRADVLRCAVV